MDRIQKITGSILSIISIIISLIFVFYGSLILSSEEIPKWIIAFSTITVIYGLCSLTALIMAWFHYGESVKKCIKYLAVGFMIIFFLGSFDGGIVSGLEIVGLIIVGLMLFINWFAVSVVVKISKSLKRNI